MTLSGISKIIMTLSNIKKSESNKIKIDIHCLQIEIKREDNEG